MHTRRINGGVVMWKDEIVEEVRKYREEYAAKFNFDLQAMYEDLKKAERKSKHKKVSFKPKKPVRVELKTKSSTR
jgi:hypothetical protein